MALVDATLASGIELPATDDPAAAISTFAAGFEAYMEGGAAPGPAIPGSMAGAKSAMEGAMSGWDAADAGAAAIQSGIVAFWGVVASSAASIWPPATAATPPPTLSAISAALVPVFAANTAGSLDETACAQAIAAAIHANNLGGIAIHPPPPAGLGPVPIL